MSEDPGGHPYRGDVEPFTEVEESIAIKGANLRPLP